MSSADIVGMHGVQEGRIKPALEQCARKGRYSCMKCPGRVFVEVLVNMSPVASCDMILCPSTAPDLTFCHGTGGLISSATNSVTLGPPPRLATNNR
eukprot:scaffold195407_cov27-Prasinocladus_malaysianus.AAC.4